MEIANLTCCPRAYRDGKIADKKAVLGALALYLDFINLFMMLLQLFGQRRDN